MDTNKNYIIGVLVVLLVIGSIWGSVGTRSSKSLKKEIEAVRAEVAAQQSLVESKDAELKAIAGKAEKAHAAGGGKADALAAEVKAKDAQLAKAHNELVALRKNTKGLESRIAERDALIKKLQAQKPKGGKKKGPADDGKKVAALKKQLEKQSQELTSVKGKLKTADAKMKQMMAAQKNGAAALAAVQKKLVDAEKALASREEQVISSSEEGKEAMSKLVDEFEISQAQIIGLEKIVEEKNAVNEETSRELDRIRINMDVLLQKISDQQDAFQELQEENRELVKDLTSKNEELADLQDQLLQTPVQQ